MDGMTRDFDAKRELSARIRALMYAESSRPYREMNGELINECVGFLTAAEKRREPSKKEVRKGIEQIVGSGQFAKKRRLKSILIAACIAAFMLIANFVAMAFGTDTMSIMRDFGDRIVSMFQGQQIEYNDLTITKEKRVIFNSAEEFFESTDYDILYPAEFPQGVQLSVVTFGGSFDENNEYTLEYKDIVFVSTDTKISITVHTRPNYIAPFTTSENLLAESIGGFECYVDYFDSGIQGAFEHNGYTYIIRGRTHDDLELIIKNLRENAF